ncbi:Macrophage colony-stimulating factor 1 receptor 2 [Rhizoctonia solani]|uniref:Macrophage colony-stimulating factor 1 receptor 2 n=1 Tax=Rhizoctonia solani TaxID=456999 RepID=A0A0K6GA09_9AGAM|nr:Macrophage colony-stimulating factor 1 receptor 2 [Rhizoctonia solani]
MSSKGFRKTIRSWLSSSSSIHDDYPSSRNSLPNLPTPPIHPPQTTPQRANSQMSDVARLPPSQGSPMPARVVSEPSYASAPAMNQLPSSSFRDSLNVPRSGHSRSRGPEFLLPMPENETYALSSLSTQCALTLSEVTKEIAPIPAIGQLVGCLKHVFQAIERSKVNKDQWKLLRGRCVMVLRIAGAHVENYGKEDYPSLDDAAALLQDTLNRVEERARHYTEMNEFLALVLFQSISDEIRTLFADLDACLRLFNFTAEVAQEQWMGEYQTVQQRESSELQRLRDELEKMNINFDTLRQNRGEFLEVNEEILAALRQVLDGKSQILQDQTTTTTASYVDAQQLVRTILSVTGLRLPPKLLLGKQCILDAPIPIKTGITSDIYQASFLGGEKVAKKVFRIGMSDKDYVEKYATRFLRIASLWSSFKSDYTLPFYGIGMESYMVSPLMKNFDAMTFLKQYRDHQGMKKNILRIITDTAKGLQYLHNRHPPVVHSGMRGDNVLITDSEGGILGGFGLAKALESEENDALPPAVMTGKTESQRWMAPEMFEDEPPLKTACDVWGWAMASLEIVSGSIPYHMHKQAMTVILQINRGPPRREHYPKFEKYAYRPNEMWELLQKCWAMEPGDRPTIDEVVGRLKQIARMPEAGV